MAEQPHPYSIALLGALIPLSPDTILFHIKKHTPDTMATVRAELGLHGPTLVKGKKLRVGLKILKKKTLGNPLSATALGQDRQHNTCKHFELFLLAQQLANQKQQESTKNYGSEGSQAKHNNNKLTEY